MPAQTRRPLANAPAPITSMTRRTDLAPDVRNLAAHSPTLVSALAPLPDGQITTGEAGHGSYYKPDGRRIVLDRADHPDRAALLQTLAHEAGHVHHHATTGIDPSVEGALRDEGAAQLTNLRVVDELRAAGETESVGVAGGNGRLKRNLARDAGERVGAEAAIGDWIGDHEHPSTHPHLTYREYYGGVR